MLTLLPGIQPDMDHLALALEKLPAQGVHLGNSLGLQPSESRKFEREREDRFPEFNSTGVAPYLNMVVPVVVEVEHPVELAVQGDAQVLGVLDALAQRLPGVLLHLDVEEFPANKGEYDSHIPTNTVLVFKQIWLRHMDKYG